MKRIFFILFLLGSIICSSQQMIDITNFAPKLNSPSRFYNWNEIFDIYVDYIGGNDANSGNINHPKKTIANALLSGKKIGLKPGVSWSEMVEINSSSYNGIVVKPYSKGFSEINSMLTLGNWSKTDGYTNVYECGFSSISQSVGPVNNILSFDSSIINVQPYSCISYIPRGLSLINCDTTVNTMWTLNNSSTITKIYIHVTGGAEPSTLHCAYRIPTVSKHFNAGDQGQKCTFERLILWPVLSNTGSTLGTSNISKIFTPCNNYLHHYISSGGNLTELVFCHSNSTEDIAYVNYQSIGGFNCTMQNCLFINVNNGIYAHTSGAQYFTGKNLYYNIIFFGKIYSDGYGINNANNSGIYNNVLRNCFFQDVKWGYYGTCNSDIQDCIFKNNLTALNPKTYESYRMYVKNVLAIVKLYAISTTGLYTATHNILHLKTDTTATSLSLTSKNTGRIDHNIIIMEAPNNSGSERLYLNSRYSSAAEAIADTNYIDYNIYILCAGLSENVRWGYLTWSSMSTWITNTGHDTHSVFIDLTSKGGFSYLFNDDYTMKDVPEKAQIEAVGAGLTKIFRSYPVKPTYEQAATMLQNGTLKYYLRDLFY